MVQFDDYISAVTRRLRPDAELQMDIAHEVRTHLEDAAEAARAGGMDEDACQSEAVRAFGDVDELATALFEANRRRMRLRAVIKWTARATLMPAALLVTAFVVGAATVNLMTTAALCETFGGVGGEGFLAAMARHFPDDPTPGRNDLTNDERFVIEHLVSQDHDSAKALVERFPNDPLYHAHYTRELFCSRWANERAGTDWIPVILAALRQGRELEPDNAFYDGLTAAVLIGEASEYVTTDTHVTGLKITDKSGFDKGIAALHRAVEKGVVRKYAQEVEWEWRALRASPQTLSAQMHLRMYRASTLWDHSGMFRPIYQRLPHHALALADEGKTAEAIELLQTLERVLVMFGAQADDLVETISTQSLLIQILETRAQALEKAGQAAAAATVRARLTEENRWKAEAKQRWPVRGWAVRKAPTSLPIATQNEAAWGRRSSVLLATTRPLHMDDAALIEHTRKAELSVALRAALSLILFVALLGTVLLAALIMLDFLFRRKQDGGWQRLARTVSWTLAFPAVACVIWLCVLPNPVARYALQQCFGRRGFHVTAPVAALIAAMLLSVLAALHFLLRRRSGEHALLFFIGWKRLARIILWSVLAPAAGYWVWLCVLPNPLMEYRLDHCIGRLTFDVALLFVISAGTFFHLGCRAMRKRLAEAGMDLPEDRYFRLFHGRWGMARAAALLLVPALYIASWVPRGVGDFRPVTEFAAAAILIATWGFYTLWQLVRLRADRAASDFRGTLVRSLLPVMIVCLVAAGVLTHTVLPWTERRAVSHFNQPGYQPLLDEFPMNDTDRILRAHHRELDRQWRERQKDAEPSAVE
jgi:hypothetical protein